MYHLALRTLRGGLLVLLTSCGAELSQEAESDCHMEAAPVPGELGGWGPTWGRDGEVVVYPLSGAELRMEVHVRLSSGRQLAWTEDLPVSNVPFSVPLLLPPEPAQVRVRLTALHPETGRMLGHQAIRQDDLVHLFGRAEPDEVVLPSEISL